MKNNTLSILSSFGLWMLLLSGCAAQSTSTHSNAIAPTETNGVNMANPAAVYCEKQGYRLKTYTAIDGSQSAACLFPDGSECDEWAYFRGECGPGTPAPTTENKAVEAAKILLAKELDMDASQITIFSLEKIIWQDSCLGISGQGETCNAVEIPGFRLILTVGEDHYAYHTDLVGENIRKETAGTHGQ